MRPTNPPQTYVCGFVFDSPVQNVALIRKDRGPANMAGKLNGIGGKLELGESPRGAQSREFREEAGILIPPEDWTCFHIERYLDTGSKVFFMAAKSINFHSIKTMESEQVVTVGADARSMVDLIDTMAPMYNLCYLIPMAATWLLRPGDRYHEA